MSINLYFLLLVSKTSMFPSLDEGMGWTGVGILSCVLPASARARALLGRPREVEKAENKIKRGGQGNLKSRRPNKKKTGA